MPLDVGAAQLQEAEVVTGITTYNELIQTALKMPHHLIHLGDTASIQLLHEFFAGGRNKELHVTANQSQADLSINLTDITSDTSPLDLQPFNTVALIYDSSCFNILPYAEQSLLVKEYIQRKHLTSIVQLSFFDGKDLFSSLAFVRFDSETFDTLAPSIVEIREEESHGSWSLATVGNPLNPDTTRLFCTNNVGPAAINQMVDTLVEQPVGVIGVNMSIYLDYLWLKQYSDLVGATASKRDALILTTVSAGNQGRQLPDAEVPIPNVFRIVAIEAQYSDTILQSLTRYSSYPPTQMVNVPFYGAPSPVVVPDNISDVKYYNGTSGASPHFLAHLLLFLEGMSAAERAALGTDPAEVLQAVVDDVISHNNEATFGFNLQQPNSLQVPLQLQLPVQFLLEKIFSEVRITGVVTTSVGSKKRTVDMRVYNSPNDEYRRSLLAKAISTATFKRLPIDLTVTQGHMGSMPIQVFLPQKNLAPAGSKPGYLNKQNFLPFVMMNN